MAFSSKMATSRIARLNSDDLASSDSELNEVISDYFSRPLDLSENESSSDEEYESQRQEAGELDIEDQIGDISFRILQDVNVDHRAERGSGDFAGNAGKLGIKPTKFVCSCKLNNGQPCSLRFSSAEMQDPHYSNLTLQREELDMVILAQICAGIHTGEMTACRKQKAQTERKRVRIDYWHRSQKICRDTFLFLHGISKNKLSNLISHFQKNGVTSRQHGNAKKAPKHSLTFNDRLYIVRFISNYAEEHAVSLSGRVPGYARDDLKLLPSSCTKTSLYKIYSDVCLAAGKQAAAERTFCNIWKECLPDITMKPATDLCWTCHRNTALLSRTANRPEEEKLQLLSSTQEHVQRAADEQAEYNRIKQKAKDAAQEKRLLGNPLFLHEPGTCLSSCSQDLMTHYSFDFTQQIHYPANPLQPGPIYFKTPRKCGVFGIIAEALPQMALFLLDEAVETGKGANTVISLLDFFFMHMGLQETECHLHAGNRAGQNKNNAILHYLLWRVMTGRHQKITLSFLISGHTKFSPDWCFALFKRQLRRTKVDCLQDIVECARMSSSAGIIIPQLCGTEDGSVCVPTRDWSSFLATYFKKLEGLKKFHHFEFLQSGEVHVRESCSSEKQVFDLIREAAEPDGNLPPIITPSGLSLQRVQYLYDEIREFVASEHQDTVCPPPPTHPSDTGDEASTSGAATIPSSSSALTAAAAPRKPGRPKKRPGGLAALNAAAAPRKPGRPKKHPGGLAALTAAAAPRKPGRPKKHPGGLAALTAAAAPRKPGRPKKCPRGLAAKKQTSPEHSDQMESSDQLVLSDVKIEIDVAEEPEPPLGSQHHCSGTKRDYVNSIITPSEEDCRNPSTAAMNSEPDSQSSSGHGINTKLVDSLTGDTFQPANLFPFIKAEPVNDSSERSVVVRSR